MGTPPAPAPEGRNRVPGSAGWMTTGDCQQLYNVAGAIGTSCLLPGVCDRLDVPDLTILAAPNHSIVIRCSEDDLFPPEGHADPARKFPLDRTAAPLYDISRSTRESAGVIQW